MRIFTSVFLCSTFSSKFVHVVHSGAAIASPISLAADLIMENIQTEEEMQPLATPTRRVAQAYSYKDSQK
jgi:hypothetical protein